MVTQGVQNKLVITCTPLVIVGMVSAIPKVTIFIKYAERCLIFSKNIITSYFKAKLVLAAPASRIYLLQKHTFVYLFNKLLLTVTYLLLYLN